MFSSVQSPLRPGCALQQKRIAGSASVDLEWLLAKNQPLNVDIVDTETREQILQSLMIRMRQRGYLRRLPVSKLRSAV